MPSLCGHLGCLRSSSVVVSLLIRSLRTPSSYRTCLAGPRHKDERISLAWVFGYKLFDIHLAYKDDAFTKRGLWEKMNIVTTVV